MRGLPGSGKSYLANLIKDKVEGVICSADHYFEKNGIYTFDKSKLGQAHKKCFDKAVANFKKNKIVIVDNTNITLKEINPYLDIGFSSVFMIESYMAWRYDLDELVKRNTHGVPRTTLELMSKKWIKKEDVINSVEVQYLDKRYELIEHNLI